MVGGQVEVVPVAPQFGDPFPHGAVQIVVERLGAVGQHPRLLDVERYVGLRLVRLVTRHADRDAASQDRAHTQDEHHGRGEAAHVGDQVVGLGERLNGESPVPRRRDGRQHGEFHGVHDERCELLGLLAVSEDRCPDLLDEGARPALGRENQAEGLIGEPTGELGARIDRLAEGRVVEDAVYRKADEAVRRVVPSLDDDPDQLVARHVEDRRTRDPLPGVPPGVAQVLVGRKVDRRGQLPLAQPEDARDGLSGGGPRSARRVRFGRSRSTSTLPLPNSAAGGGDPRRVKRRRDCGAEVHRRRRLPPRRRRRRTTGSSLPVLRTLKVECTRSSRRIRATATDEVGRRGSSRSRVRRVSRARRRYLCLAPDQHDPLLVHPSPPPLLVAHRTAPESSLVRYRPPYALVTAPRLSCTRFVEAVDRAPLPPIDTTQTFSPPDASPVRVVAISTSSSSVLRPRTAGPGPSPHRRPAPARRGPRR